jgi:hypothetical protein
MWIATRPYRGVVHDARLYLIQALRALEPGRYDQDLYFKFGSQDAFTIFTAGYKPLVVWLGPAGAHLAATLGGEALWLSALMALIWSVFPSRAERWLAVGGAVLLWAGYGGGRVFTYGESFATPRLFAEALVMAALALGLRKRLIVAAAVLVVAGLIHPLAAACGAGVLLVRAALHDRRVWIVIGALAAAGVLAAASGLGPFTRALAHYDDAWFQVVRLRNSFVFLTGWSQSEYCQVAATLAVLATAVDVGGERDRRLVLTVLAVTLGSLAVSVLGADIARNVLITELQVWRTLWLTTVLANAFLPVILLRGDVQGWPRKLLMSGAVASGLGRFFPGLELIAPALILAACALAAALRRANAPLRRPLEFLAIAALCLAAWFQALIVQVEVGLDPDLAAHLAGAFVAALAAAGLVWSMRRGVGVRLTAIAGLLVLAALALADQRTPWTKYVYGPAASDGLAAFLSGAGHTYWEGDGGFELLWFRQGAPSYYSCVQGTEALFFRGTAEDFARRGAPLRALNTADFAPEQGPFCGKRNNPGAVDPTSPDQLAAACRALPDLDTLVLDRPVPGVATRVWQAPAYQTDVGGGRPVRISNFFRYSCASFR